MNFTSELTGVSCWLSVVALVSWIVGRIVFSPLNERTLLFKVDRKFRISDLIILAIHLQLTIGLVFLLAPLVPRDVKAAVAICVCILLGFWWIIGVRILARGGVRYTWHRWLFLGLVMPVGFLSGLSLVVTGPVSMALLFNSIGDEQIEGAVAALGMLFLFALALGAAACCRHTCRMIAARARDDRARRDGIKFDDMAHRERFTQLHSHRQAGSPTTDMTAGIWVDDEAGKPGGQESNHAQRYGGSQSDDGEEFHAGVRFVE